MKTLIAPVISALLILSGCSDGRNVKKTGDGSAAADGMSARDGSTCSKAKVKTVASCSKVIGTSYACAGELHEDESKKLIWAHNPPSSGDHFGSWESKRGEPVRR